MRESQSNFLELSPLEDGKHWVVNKSFFYATKDNKHVICIGKGFVTDFASVPRPFWFLFPPWGKYGKGAIIHDFLYRTKTFKRKKADKIFLEIMQQSKVCFWQRTTIYYCLRIFGWYGWHFPSKKHEKFNNYNSNNFN